MKSTSVAALCFALSAFLPAAQSFARTGEESGSSAATQPTKAKVVELKLGGFGEDPKPQNPFGPSAMNFRARLKMLQELAADPAVAGVMLKINGAPDFARSLDLLHELRRVKASGKKIACYLELVDQRSLMFASLADVLAVPPSGAIMLEGLAAEIMYMKDLLEMLNVKVHVLHVGEFKTAYEELTKPGMTAEQRKTIESILDEQFKQLIATVAENRGMQPQAVESLFDKVLVQPDDAKAAGLISHVAYEDQFDAQCERLFGGPYELDKKYGRAQGEDIEKMLENPFGVFQLLGKMMKPQEDKLPAEPRVAVIYATGAINSGKSQSGFDGEVSSMGSETIVAALEKARNDDWVKAVVLRVNSPGGSALASDMIWRAVERVREKKPIISSMGSVAASGGYWISMGCDRIMAQPSTITGSIGVVSMLPDVSGVMKRFGVKVEIVGKGPRVNDLAMMGTGPSEFLKNLITTSMQDTYQEFLAKAATGRKTTKDAIDAIARGRVWTGREALDLNLVDRLGSFEDAIAWACELGGNLDPKTTAVVEYPNAPNFLEQFQDQMEEMTVAQIVVERGLIELGFGDLVAVARAWRDPSSTWSKDNVMALMPFTVSIR